VRAVARTETDSGLPSTDKSAAARSGERELARAVARTLTKGAGIGVTGGDEE
jgi:hypothetical protein